MPSTASLMGLGMPGALANIVGVQIVTLAGAGTTQGAGTVIGKGQTCVLANSLSGATGYVLPASVPIGHVVEFYVTGDTIARLFPHVGGAIDREATDAVKTVAVGRGTRLRRVSATSWVGIIGDQA